MRTTSPAYRVPMTLSPRELHAALNARDARFDGVFFVGITTTGVYCRPICPARSTRVDRRRFFETPQEAEAAGFRPCLRCRPELAPGQAPVDAGQRTARLIVQRLEDGQIDAAQGLGAIAAQFDLSARQVRRIVRRELGVSPVQLLLTRRLLLAKQLLTETRLPVVDVAFASGFSSLRRFNDAFSRRYRMPPTRLRARAAADEAAIAAGGTSTLLLAYRSPYDWAGMLRFLSARALAGVEHVTDASYARTVRLGRATGWIRVTQSTRRDALQVEFTHGLLPVLSALLGRVRALFDLDARPDMIAAHLADDPRLRTAVAANPGLRVPGAFDGFEMGARAIVGQQVTVRAATTIAGRFVQAFGDPIVTPVPELIRLTPTPDRVAAATVDDIARHGIIAARSRSLIALGDAYASGRLALDGGGDRDPERAIAHLIQIPGIGPWTAHYIAMRALRWPDAFPKEDVVICARLGGVTAKQAEALSQPWRPWRSYAVLHLWRSDDAPPGPGASQGPCGTIAP